MRILLAIILFLTKFVFALSVNEIMDQSWQNNLRAESVYAVRANVDGTERKTNSSQVAVVKKIKVNQTSTNSVNIPGIGVVKDGVFDLKEDTHLIFYTDGVVLKLDY